MARRSNVFVALLASFVLALLLASLPLPSALAYWRPEFVTMVLIFWVLYRPYLVGVWTGFLLGILLDVLFNTPFGVHPLMLSVVAYLARLSYRWVTVFSMLQTSGLVFALVFAALLLKHVVVGIVAVGPHSLLFWLPALTSALLWPTVVLSLRRFVSR